MVDRLIFALVLACCLLAVVNVVLWALIRLVRWLTRRIEEATDG